MAAFGFAFMAVQYFTYRRKVKNLSALTMIQQVDIDHLQTYKAVVQNSPDLFVIVDQGLQVMVANHTAAQYGWQASRSFLDAKISGTSKMHFDFELKHVLKEGYPTDGEIRLVMEENNNWKFFMYHIFPVKDENGQVTGATITAIDITAQREAETELNRQREFIEGIMNEIPDAIYVKDDHQRFLYGNKAFSEIVGRGTVDYSGLNDEDLFASSMAANIKRQDREVLRTNTPSDVEEEVITTEGRKLTVLSKRIPFQFHSGRKVLIAIMRDFSERKRLERELHIHKVRQEEASRLATLGETAGGIAHEINNPLNVIVGIAELLKAKVEMGGVVEQAKLVEYYDRLVKYSMRIAKIIKGLRSISRDASHDPFAEVSLNHVVDETMELCRQQFTNRGIELTIKLSNPEIFVLGRFAQLSQIIMNLMNNARDAVDGVASPAVFIEISQIGENGIIRVWDSGPGISDELAENIMKPFFTTKPAGKGTGLGLSISSSIALDHKGVLLLNREVATSCFELQLPLLAKVAQKNSA